MDVLSVFNERISWFEYELHAEYPAIPQPFLLHVLVCFEEQGTVYMYNNTCYSYSMQISGKVFRS